MFDGDLARRERAADARLGAARNLAGDDRLAATIAQRSAFLATSRMRGREAVEWAERALTLAPGDTATGLLIAPSQALGLSFMGQRKQAHAALDRWLDDPFRTPSAAAASSCSRSKASCFWPRASWSPRPATPSRPPRRRASSAACW